MQGNNAAAIAPGRQIIRRLDPRTKLALLLMSFVVVLLPQRPAVVALGQAAVLLHLTLARAWPALKPVRWLLVALALFSLGVWSFLAQGPSHLFWRVSRESLAFGAANFLKLASMMVAGLTLLATTPAEELFVGLAKLRLPYRRGLCLCPGPALGPGDLRHRQPGEGGPGSPGPGLGAGQSPGAVAAPPALAGAYLSPDPAPQPDHGLGPGGPGLPDEPPPHLSPGDPPAAPGLAGPGRGRRRA